MRRQLPPAQAPPTPAASFRSGRERACLKTIKSIQNGQNQPKNNQIQLNGQNQSKIDRTTHPTKELWRPGAQVHVSRELKSMSEKYPGAQIRFPGAQTRV